MPSKSLFPPFLCKSCDQILLGLGQIPWGSPVPLLLPQAGKPDSKPSQQWKSFFGIMFSSLWVTHPAGMGFDFIVTVPLLPSHCGFFFVSGRGALLSGRFRRPPVDGCSAASALARGADSMCSYSAILNWKSPALFLD